MARAKTKQLVKYDNDLNLVAFKDFSKVENAVFFALMWKLKEQENKEVRLDFGELRELIDLRNMTNREIEKQITDIGKKISIILIEFETETERQFFTIFQVLAVPKNTDDFYIRAKINEPFLYILNSFKNGGFTIFELMEFSTLSSKYTQTLYRLLKQFRGEGTLFLKWDKFLELMDIPKSYGMSDIDKQILKPAIKELSEDTLFSSDRVIFKNLRYEKIRGRGRGRPVSNINFYFTKENTDNKNKRAIKKESARLKKEQENQEFENQFYGKNFKYQNSTFLIYTIEKLENKINAKVENLRTKEIQIISFKSIEQIQEQIEKYENNNETKDRPEIKKLVEYIKKSSEKNWKF